MHTALDVCALSSRYAVRPLLRPDAPAVLALCEGNPLFYRYHPPFVTLQSIYDDMDALPPGRTVANKHYVGFWSGGELVAVLDLVEDYPREDTAMLGFFMMDARHQGRGEGSAIIGGCMACLRDAGFACVRLGIDRDNPQSRVFWTKNGFVLTGEEVPNDFSSYLMMERNL